MIELSHKPLIRAYNMDCMEFMAGVGDKAYSLACCDPPYGIGVNHNMGRRHGDKPSNYKPALWDDRPPEKSYFDELFRISTNQIVWGANHFISQMPYDSPCWILWDKLFSDEISFAQFELAWTSFDTTSKKFDRYPGQVLRIHPTQKPVALYRWLLTHYAKPGQTILDTHGGSFSSAIACWHEGYDMDIVELDTEYFEAACERFERETRQQKLFGERA